MRKRKQRRKLPRFRCLVTFRKRSLRTLCFYTCLSFCSQGGCLPQCMLGYTPPGADTPSPGADPPGGGVVNNTNGGKHQGKISISQSLSERKKTISPSLSLRFIHLNESERKSDIATRCAVSNFPFLFALSSGKDQRIFRVRFSLMWTGPCEDTELSGYLPA